MAAKDKNSALKTALTQLDKQFGAGTIMRMGDKPDSTVSAIPTGAINLDAALGIGGIPRGRITEIYGPEASGKTTLALHCVAESQKQDGVVAFIDVEHALDPVYAGNIGVDTENLLLSQPDGGEQALEIVETLVRSNAIDLIVIDSVAALVPRAEIEGSMGDTHVGLQARLMSQALRKLTGIISKSNTSVIFINQTRMKIGVPAYVNPETTTGGVALKFYSSLRMEVRRIGSIKQIGQGAEIIGNKTRVKIVKNKFAPPFKKVEFPIVFGKGISHFDLLVEIAVEHDIVNRSGSWFSYGEIKIGQGSEKVKDFLLENEEILNEIEVKVKVALGLIESSEDETENDKED
ncbi:MAG: recombinase RecA [Candidatus Cloacimonetes bacterium]|jgi:recombination protein RecA|nr:recombinase RecA [Candidatus Cloacimonadota bacterium]MBT4332376.1 recombinase RecA [Candidatus Cloacimonadota bacterium]